MPRAAPIRALAMRYRGTARWSLAAMWDNDRLRYGFLETFLRTLYSAPVRHLPDQRTIESEYCPLQRPP